MKTVSISEGKAQLSSLVRHVMRTGESVALVRLGEPVAKLVPWQPSPAPQRVGAFAGRVTVAPDFAEWGAEERRALGMED